VRSFWGEVIKRTAEIEKALGESMEFVASPGLLQLQTKQLEEMTNGGDRVANDGEVDLLRRAGLWERKSRNEMERSGFLPSAVKFALQILLRDLDIVQGHADIFVSQQLHESGQTDAEA
jgi:hypothetical protein